MWRAFRRRSSSLFLRESMSRWDADPVGHPRVFIPLVKPGAAPLSRSASPGSSCTGNAYCDHVGGCSPIIEAMPVTMLFDSGQTYSGRAYRDCIASANAHNVPIMIARRGIRWNSGDDVNESSIVVMLRGQTSRNQTLRELFMGDAGPRSFRSAPARPLSPRARRGSAEDMTSGDPSTLFGMTRDVLAAIRAPASTCDDDLRADVAEVVKVGVTTDRATLRRPRSSLLSNLRSR